MVNPYGCGHPGCNRSFTQREHLIQHTKDFHTKRPTAQRANPTGQRTSFPCGYPNCSRTFSQHESLQRHTRDAHKKPPQPQVLPFKCGVQGCGQRFLNVELLRDHTKKVHPKPKPNQPARQQTVRHQSTSSSSYSLPRYFPSRPVRMLPSPAISMQGLDWVGFNSPGPSSTARVNDITPNVEDQRLLALEQDFAQFKLAVSSSPPPIINKSGLRIYRKYVELAERVISDLCPEGQKSSLWERLREILKTMDNLDDISSLVRSAQFCMQVDELLKDLDYTDEEEINKVLDKDNEHAFHHVLGPLFMSTTEETRILALREEEAKAFMDVLGNCIRQSNNRQICDRARRILRKLSDLSHHFPPSIYITGVQTDSEQFAAGGFADIFRGDFNGEPVVLKRLRVTLKQQTDELWKDLRQEVLTWSNLDQHGLNFILPFLGLNQECFPLHFPCIVTPYMREGTIMEFIQNHSLTNRSIDKLISEIAQGLQYLHSNSVVHGDLRGANIFINDQGYVQLADFGLAAVSDTTRGSHSTSNRDGSTRWMAPELHYPSAFGLRFERTPASDVYAFACSCMEIYTQKPPFPELPHDMAVALQVIGEGRPPRPSGPPNEPREMADELWNIIQVCWTHQPTARPTMDKVLDMMKEFDFGVLMLP